MPNLRTESLSNSPGDFCDLCGLPLRRAAVSDAISQKTCRFCCPGCRQVFNLLLESGASADPAAFRETELFQKCREIGIIPRSENDLIGREKSLHPGESSGPPAGAPSVPKPSDGSRTTLDLTLKVDNMWCPACAWVIEAYLRKTAGIISADCNFSTDYLRCEYDPVATTPDAIMHTLQSLGYRPLPLGEKDSSGRRWDFIRFGVSAFLTANVMMLSFALYSGFFSALSAETIRNLSWPIFIMTAIVLSYGGYPLYRKAFAGFFSAAFGMETLITIGAASAFCFSIVNLMKGSIHLYFDTTCMLITLVLLGKLLEKNAKYKVQADLEDFFALRPAKVRICSDRFPDGRYVDAAHLQAQDHFFAAEKEAIAADGCVLEGEALLDVSALTGEALPIKVKAGERVCSGSMLVSGRLKIKAEAVGVDSILGQMIQAMESALLSKTTLEDKADRLLRLFVPAVVCLAVASAAGCLLAGLSFESALVRMVTVLVIACPCALGIAVPLTRVAAIALAAKSGILIRDFGSIEKAGRLSAVVFDKTGTLTHGRWELQDLVVREPCTAAQVISLALSLEAGSDHIIAAEIRRYAAAHHIAPVDLENICHYENGISGRYNGAEAKIGSGAFLQKELAAAPGSLLPHSEDYPVLQSLIYMSLGGALCAVLIFGDKIKAGAVETVRQLKLKGLKTCLVSGDAAETARIVAARLKIQQACGELLPQQKADFIKTLQTAGLQVAMVGDGINDAAALVQSNLSIAVHSGSYLGSAVANVTLMRSDPRQVMDFLGLAGRINSKISQNLLFSLIYNVGSIPLAISGLLNPLIAVSAMLLSSLTVIGNTLLLIRSRPPDPDAGADPGI